jgi:hypothetical protein
MKTKHAQDNSLLGYFAVYCRRSTFQKCLLPLSSGLMMDTVSTSETSVFFYETTRRYIAAGCHVRTCHRENLKSHDTHA